MEKPEDPCPQCSTTRDVRFIDMQDKDGKPSETRRAFECEGCEIARPCCPKCGSVRIGRVRDDQKRMVCARCGTEFPDPEIQDSESKTKLTDSEVDFLVDLAGRFSGNLRGLQSWVEFQESECDRLGRPVERSKRDYVEHHVKLYLVVRRIIALRRKSTGTRDPVAEIPHVAAIEEELLCRNLYVGPITEQIRRGKAEALRDSLIGLFAPAGVSEELVEQDSNAFLREGKRWRIRYKGQEIRLDDRLGLGDIAQLLADPGAEIGALNLFRGEFPPPAPAFIAYQLEAEGLTLTSQLRNGILSDPDLQKTLQNYRRRKKEIEEEKADAKEFLRYDDLEKLEEEEDFIKSEIARRTNIHGKIRPRDEGERARSNVQRRIKRAIAAIERDCPSLARHLSNQIKTGRYCRYNPDPADPINWEL